LIGHVLDVVQQEGQPSVLVVHRRIDGLPVALDERAVWILDTPRISQRSYNMPVSLRLANVR
jgi:hypothetical protein